MAPPGTSLLVATRRHTLALASMTTLTLTLALAPTLGLAFGPDDAPPGARAAVKAKAAAKARSKGQPSASDTADGGKLAREATSILRELSDAVKAEGKAADKASNNSLPTFPPRTVTPPTLTSATLDQLVDQFLVDSKAPPAALTTDVEFVRRIYLDITGKLPTPEQTRGFVGSRESKKRAKLIDVLLASPAYAENWARYWRDVIRFRATNQNNGRVRYGELEEWLAKQLAANRPWDEVTRALLTATGRNDENGAVVFSLAHVANNDIPAPELAGEVSRIFLGVQIQCAQCHDHPNDAWKRQQFHEFASFFAGGKARRAGDQGANAFEVVQLGRPRYTMPDLKDPNKAIPVSPRFFLASNAPSLPSTLTSADRHDLAARYIIAQDNPWFARAFVNRIWYALLGDSFYTPVDDLGPQRTARAPEVMNALATQWQQGGYDVRWLFRTILNSKAYQREVRSTLSASGRTPFAANCPSRLRADQILDSLAQALKFPVDASNPGAVSKKAIAQQVKDNVGKTKNAARGGNGPRLLVNTLFGVDPSIPSDEILGTIPQALFLMNNTLINGLIEARSGTVLGEILSATPDNRAALNALYVRVLAREPTAKEIQICGRYLESVGDRRQAFEDILWSLVNSTEFITRR